MKIKSITIKNFKAFDDITIDFTSNKNGAEKDIELGVVTPTKDGKKVIPYVNVIMGRNSIGKTTLLKAIQFFADFLKNKNKKIAKEKFIKNKKHNSNILKKNSFDFNNAFYDKEYENIEQDIEKGKYDYDKELMQLESNLYIKEYKNYARDNKKQIEISLELDYKENQNIKLCYPIFEQGTSKYEPYFSIKTLNKKEKLFNNIEIWSKNIIMTKFYNNPKQYIYLLNNDFENNIDWLMVKFKSKLKELNDLIKLANPKFIEFINDKGALRYVEKGSSIPLSINSLSSGTQRFLQLIYYIMKFAEKKSGILLIDEMENCLHNELVNVIKIGLTTIARKYDLQIIFTTHNPLILKQFISNKQVISLDDENEKVVPSKVSSKIKPKNNIIKKYVNSEIAIYPDPELAQSISRKIFNKW